MTEPTTQAPPTFVSYRVLRAMGDLRRFTTADLSARTGLKRQRVSEYISGLKKSHGDWIEEVGRVPHEGPGARSRIYRVPRDKREEVAAELQRKTPQTLEEARIPDEARAELLASAPMEAAQNILARRVDADEPVETRIQDLELASKYLESAGRRARAAEAAEPSAGLRAVKSEIDDLRRCTDVKLKVSMIEASLPEAELEAYRPLIDDVLSADSMRDIPPDSLETLHEAIEARGLGFQDLGLPNYGQVRILNGTGLPEGMLLMEEKLREHFDVDTVTIEDCQELEDLIAQSTADAQILAINSEAMDTDALQIVVNRASDPDLTNCIVIDNGYNENINVAFFNANGRYVSNANLIDNNVLTERVDNWATKASGGFAAFAFEDG